MKTIKKILFLSFFLFGKNLLFAQVSPYEVKVGNPLRKTILEVLRTPINKELGQKVEFVVNVMMQKGNWAFAYGMMQQTGGKPLDRSKFVDKEDKESAEAQIWDDNFQAVLKKKNGKWEIVQRSLGCTDVCWAGWWNEIKGAPRDIFPQ